MKPAFWAGIGVAVAAALAGIVLLGGGDPADPAPAPFDRSASGDAGDGGATDAIAAARGLTAPDSTAPIPRADSSRGVGEASRRAVGALRGVGEEAAPGLVVTGRAVDVDGRPLEGMEAGLRVGIGTAFSFLAGAEDADSDEPPLVVGETGRDGRFRLELDQTQAAEVFPPNDSGPGGAAGGFFVAMMAPRLEVELDGGPYAAVKASVAAAEQGGAVEIGDVVLELAVLVSGTVTTPDGDAVSGARIIRREVDRSSGGALDTWSWDFGESGDVVATTDAEGRFEADDLAPGMFSLAPRASGYLAGSPTVMDLYAGEASDVLDLVLDPGVTVTGTVLDEDGRPIAKAKVWAQMDDGRSRWRNNDDDPERAFAKPGQDQTGPDGLFTLSGLSSEKEIKIRARRLMRGEASASVQPPATGVVLRLSKQNARITGRVVDERGQPVTKGRAAAVGNGQMPFNIGIFGNGQRASLRRGGKFEIDGLKAGTYDVVIQSDGYLDSRVEDVEVDGHANVGEVVIRKGSAVRVRVVAENGRGVPEVKVHLDPSKESMERLIVTSANAGRSRSTRVTSSQRSKSETTDGEGVATFAVVADGEWEAYVWGDGAGSPEAVPVSVSGGKGDAEVELVIVALASAHGAVRDRNGTPLGQVKVEFERTEPKAEGGFEENFERMFANMQRGKSDSTVTRQDGTYSVKNLQPGPYEVRVGPPPDDEAFPFAIFMSGVADDEPPAAKAELLSGQDVLVDVTAPDWGVLHGMVRSGGLPAAGARIQATRMRVREDGTLRSGWQGSGERKTDASGFYEIGGLRTGTYEITAVAKEGGLPWTERVEVRGLRVRLDVDLPGGVIEGRVVDARNGNPIGGAKILVQLQLEPQDEGDLGSRAGLHLDLSQAFGNADSSANARTDASGRFRVEGLPPGRLKVSASAGNTGLAPDSVAVELGLDVFHGGVELRLQAPGKVHLRIIGYTAASDGEGGQWAQLAGLDGQAGGGAQRVSMDGAAVWTGLAPGRYRCTVDQPGGKTHREDLVVEAGESTNVEVDWTVD